MRTDDRDRELAQLFEEQRRADEASAPALRELLARPPRLEAPGRRNGWRIALAAATAVAAIAGVFVLRPARPGGQTEPPPAASQLASWKAPTDALLQTPGSELWTSVPILVSQDSPPMDVQPAHPVQTTKGVGE